MKIRRICLGIVFALLFYGCGSQENPGQGKKPAPSAEVKKEAKEGAAAGKKSEPPKHDKLVKEMEDKIAGYEKEIKELWRKAQGAAAEMRPQLQKEMAEVQKDLEDAKKKLAEWRSADGRAWEDMKSGMEATMGKLEEAYQKAKSRMK